MIHPDGTAHYYMSAEETPEYKAKVEAEHKAKQEKKAKQAKAVNRFLPLDHPIRQGGFGVKGGCAVYLDP